MKLRFLFIVLAIFFFNTADSQSFYETLFHFGANKNDTTAPRYWAFFVVNDDGTGNMRIRYDGAKPEESFLIEGELKQGFAKDKKGNIDQNKMYYTCRNYIDVTTDSPDNDLPPITFWFTYYQPTDEYLPWGVMTKDEQGKNLEGFFDGEVRLLEEKDFTKELVLTYFTKDEEIYKNLFATNIRSLPQDIKASKMYLLTVTDTEDDNIGPDCETDRKKQQAYFTKLAGKLEIPIVVSEILGKDLSKANVLTKIDEIAATKNDIVIFYYSGHGYSKEDGRLFPYMDLRPDKDIPIKKENELNMEEVYSIIKSKPSRLNLCISDCCNWHASISNAKSTNIANTRPSPVGLSVENMRALFMNPQRTSIMMTAAAKGQVSAGNANDGGIFTGQFRDALQKFMSITYQNISWQQITENAQIQTSTVAGYSVCPQPDNPKVFKDCVQTPVFRMN